MNQRDLFDAFGRLPEQYLNEAFGTAFPAEQRSDSPKKHDPAEKNEIDMIFQAKPAAEPAAAEPVRQSSRAETVPAAPPYRSTPQKNSRRGIWALTAAAAAVVLFVGGFVWKVRQDSVGTSPDAPANSAADSSTLNVQQSDPEAETVTGISTAATSADTTADETGKTSETEPAAEPQSDAETNFFGAHGEIRVAAKLTDSGYSFTQLPLLEDDENWYLYAVDSKGAVRLQRVSKTERTDSGYLFLQDPCQKQGCTHSGYDSCPQTRFASGTVNNLLTDGTDLYWQNFLLSDNTLQRFRPDGDTEIFFDPSGILASVLKIPQSQIDTIEMIQYYRIVRLGDSGMYLISMNINTNATGRSYTLLYQPETGEVRSIDEEGTMYSNPVYDEGSGLLYLTKQAAFGIGLQLCVYDVRQHQLRDFGEPTVVIPCYAANGMLYATEQVRADENGQQETALIEINPETGDSRTLESTAYHNNYVLKDGKRYSIEHHSVGKDKVICCDPDGSNPKTVYETSSAIESVQAVVDESFFVVTENTAHGIFVINGEGIPCDFALR